MAPEARELVDRGRAALVDPVADRAV
jgi:hypothetical protein